MPSERLKRDMLLLCCLSYLYNINRMINSAHTSRPVRSDTLFINLNGLCIFQTCDLKSDTLILKNELRQRLCNSEQLQRLQRFDSALLTAVKAQSHYHILRWRWNVRDEPGTTGAPPENY